MHVHGRATRLVARLAVGTPRARLGLVPDYGAQTLPAGEAEEMVKLTIRPYKPSASANTRISMMDANSFGCWLMARTPASPTTPIARPAATAARPTHRPLDRCA